MITLILDNHQNRVYLLSECDSEMVENFPTRYVPLSISDNLSKILTSHPEATDEDIKNKEKIINIIDNL